MDAEIESLKKSMAKLRALLYILFAVLAIGIALLVFRSSGPDQEVDAGAFRLVDANGSLRAVLEIRDDQPGLWLADEDGVERLEIFHSPEATGVYVNDSDAVTRIGIAQFAHGGGGVALHGPASKGAAVLYLKNEGSLRFFDADGEVSNEIRATPLTD